MATYPTDPNLPAVTTTTAVNPPFLNTFTDNINAIGADLADLSDNAGNIDLAIDKGIAWATTLEIYKSGGDLVIDDNVGITGNLDITGAISAGSFTVSGSLDVPGTLTVDIINDSGAAQITINETIEMAAGKGLRGDGSSALLLPNGCNITGNLDVSGTLTVDTIDDSGAGLITVSQSMELNTGDFLKAGTLHVNDIYQINNVSGCLEIWDDVIIDNGTDTELIVRSAPGDEIVIHADADSRYIDIDSCDAGDPAFPANDRGRIFLDSAGNLIVKIAEGIVDKEGILMPFAPAAYTVTNDLTDRAYDANTVAIAELADVVGTIIADLQTLGLLG